jgi:hypothetical protein
MSVDTSTARSITPATTPTMMIPVVELELPLGKEKGYSMKSSTTVQ